MVETSNSSLIDVFAFLKGKPKDSRLVYEESVFVH